MKALEEKQGVDLVTTALTSVRNALQKPEAVYDPWEASAHVEALVRAARSSAHEKADYYAAILDELKGRSNALSPSAHKRLLMGLLGDPVRAKVAKESSALLKTIQREEPGFQGRNSTRQFRRHALMSTVRLIVTDVVYQGISPEIVAADAAAEILGVSIM